MWPIRAPEQIVDRFYILGVEFLLLRHRHLSHKMSQAVKSEERQF